MRSSALEKGLVGRGGIGCTGRVMIRSGLVSVSFRQLPPSAIVTAAAAAGLQGIEWGGDLHVPHGDLARAREVGERTRQAGLAVASYGSYYRCAASEAEGLPFARVLDTALALEAPGIRVWAGRVSPHQAGPAERRAVEEDLARIAELAAAAGREVWLEFHGGTLTETRASAAALLAAVPHPALGSLWQPALGVSPGERLADLAALSPRLAHLHVFHWGPTGPRDRRPLREGEEEWRHYLSAAAALPTARPRHALLEFVRDDSLASLAEDAATLRAWLGADLPRVAIPLR